MAEDIEKILNKKELYLTGLDVIDEKIIEINVTSPCYFIREINNAYGIRFEEKIMEDIIALINSKLGQDEYSLCSK
jgi:glutathione synthase/RimK-type ligase-like ATP-grasp enzyme